MRIKGTVLPKAAIFFGVAAILVGCSNEPSESDIRDALEKTLSQTRSQAESMGGTGAGDLLNMELHNVEKIGCQEAQSGSGYECDVTVDMTSLLGRQVETQTIRIIEASDGWRIMSG